MNLRDTSIVLIALLISSATALTQGCSHKTPETQGSPPPVKEISEYARYTRQTLPDSLVGEVTLLRDRARKGGDYETYGLGCLMLANRSVHAGDYQAGISEMEAFIGRVTGSAADSAAMSKAYYRVGEFYYVNGISWAALDNFIRAADYATTERERSRILYAIGISSGNSHEASRGLSPSDYFRQAEDLARQEGDSTMIAQALFGRAGGYLDFLGVHKFRDEPLAESRIDSIRTAITILGEAGKYGGDTDVVNYALGLSHAALKDFDKAGRYVYLDTLGGHPVSTQGISVRASLLICMGRYSEAVTILLPAYEKAAGARNEAEMRNSLHLLYYAYKYSGNTAKALDAFEKFSELRQRLMDESFGQQVNVSQVRYDTKLKEQRLASAESENRLYRKGLIIISCALLLVAGLLAVIAVFYRKTRKAHKALVRKSREWAAGPMSRTKPSGPNGSPTDEQKELIVRLDSLLSADKLYLDTELTLNAVAEKLNTNRTYLSDAINRLYGDNFTQYLNEYRIKEAVNLMSDAANDKYTVETLAAMVGFGNRNAFSRAFVRVTGLFPSEFRRNRT